MIVASAAPSRPGHFPILAAERPAPSLRDLFVRQPLEAFEGGAAIFWQGDVAKHVFEVVQGVMRVFRILPDGRRIIAGFVHAGDILGISPHDCYPCTVEAVNGAKLRRLERRRFQEMTEASPALWRQFVACLCEEVACAQDQMMLLARRGAEERVCSFLLQQARRASGGEEIASTLALPMSRLDIADHLGLTIETVSRTITNLTQRGVIAPAGRHALAIRRPATLARLAGGGDGTDIRPGATGAALQAAWPN